MAYFFYTLFSLQIVLPMCQRKPLLPYNQNVPCLNYTAFFKCHQTDFPVCNEASACGCIAQLVVRLTLDRKIASSNQVMDSYESMITLPLHE